MCTMEFKKMAAKIVLLCAFAFLAQQCAGKSCYRPPSCGCGYGSGRVTISEIEEIEEISYNPISIKAPVASYVDIATNGGPFVVTSIGGIAPSGIAVASELGLGGDLILSGELPYLSAVAFEGQFASGGEVPVAYGCGDIVAITEQIGGSIGSASLGYSLPSAGCYSPPPIKSCGCKY